MWPFNARKLHLPVCLIVPLSICVTSSSAQDEIDRSEQLKSSVQKLLASKKARASNPELEGRLRETTWRLLVGELAGDKSTGLNSSAYDALGQGLKELDDILAELEKSSESARRLSSNPQLAMRLDVTQVRRTELVAKKELSRSEELARLSQLRQINKAYRDLLKHLVVAQTEAIVGESGEVAKHGEAATKNLSDVATVVGKRRDFYLFDDEPTVEGEDAELKVVQEVAAPYAEDVKRHHQALLSLTLCRLATQGKEANREMLEAALVQADEALADATSPNSVALYARGLACLELGRLLTVENPFQQKGHADATDWFSKSQDAFTQAQKAIPAGAAVTAMSKDLVRLIEEGADASSFLAQAVAAEQRGEGDVAALTLHRGISRHRNAALGMAYVEAQWRLKKAPWGDVEKLMTALLEEGVVPADDMEFLAHRGRIEVVQVWRTVSAMPEGQSVDEQRPQLMELLNQGRADLKAIPANAEPSLKWTSAAAAALGEAAALLLDPKGDLPVSQAALARAPIAVTELESLIANASPSDRPKLLEAVQLARLAEGYLALRLLPDYQDRARTAFAAAVDAGAKLPGGSRAVPPLGGAMLRALLTREGSSGDRMAQEERQLRGAMQRMLPALAALPVAEPNQVATSLSGALRDVKISEPAWDPRKQLDPRDVFGARESVLADARAITALSLLSAKQPAAALLEFVGHWIPATKIDGLAKVDFKEVRTRSAQLTDPFSVFAFSAALEEFAVTQLEAGSALRLELLEDSRTNYERALTMLGETSAWRERWPYLEGMATSARDRLSADKFAVTKAVELRTSMRLGDARSVLEQAQARHPTSIPIREQLINTIIDEAQMDTERQNELLAVALQQFEEARRSGLKLPANSLLKMAQLQEHFGKLREAAEIYREVNQQSPNPADQVKARARLAVIRARSND